MSWFVDASAVVAIIGKEEDWATLSDRLDIHPMRLWSPLSRWESVAGVRLRLSTTIEAARARVVAFGSDDGLSMVAIGEREDAIALDAFGRYGKGTGHRARLNFGDCFAYACAKTNGALLLYKGDDFAQTDLA